MTMFLPSPRIIRRIFNLAFSSGPRFPGRSTASESRLTRIFLVIVVTACGLLIQPTQSVAHWALGKLQQRQVFIADGGAVIMAGKVYRPDGTWRFLDGTRRSPNGAGFPATGAVGPSGSKLGNGKSSVLIVLPRIIIPDEVDEVLFLPTNRGK